MQSFFSALSFLTLIPAPQPSKISPQTISDSRAWFPLIGLLLGLALVGIERWAGALFPVSLTAALLLAFLIIITRGLHLDGFMDTCDGLFGGSTPERRREIMRDSHVGAFAVVGAVGLLVVKYGALVSILALSPPGKEWVLLLFPALSRWTMTLLLVSFPYSRVQGLGTDFQGRRRGITTGVAAFIALAVALCFGGWGGTAMLAGISSLAWLLGWGMSNLLGGLTGDSYGAVNELSEVVLLVAGVALLPYNLIAPLGLMAPLGQNLPFR